MWGAHIGPASFVLTGSAMTLRIAPILASALLAACSSSHGLGADAGLAPSDAGAVDVLVDAAPLPSPDAGPPPSPDAGPPPAPDAGAPPALPGAGIVCGGTTCPLPGSACIATCTRDGEPAPTCVETDDETEWVDCPGEQEWPKLILWCDGPEDCPGADVCVAQEGSSGTFPRCSCHETDDGGCAPPWVSVLCHTVADCPAWASDCRPEHFLLGDSYSVCVE